MVMNDELVTANAAVVSKLLVIAPYSVDRPNRRSGVHTGEKPRRNRSAEDKSGCLLLRVSPICNWSPTNYSNLVSKAVITSAAFMPVLGVIWVPSAGFFMRPRLRLRRATSILGLNIKVVIDTEDRKMSHDQDVHRLRINKKITSCFRPFLRVLIMFLALYISGCNLLPSSQGVADPSFFDAGLNGSDYISVILPDPERNRVVFGGRFSSIGGKPANNIAIYDLTTDRWIIPSVGVRHQSGSAYVWALAISGNSLFVGGRFTETTDGILTGLGSIAGYGLETGEWFALADGGLSNGNDDAIVNTMDVIGNNLYVGGLFTKPRLQVNNPVFSSFIIRYEIGTNTWSALPNQGLDGEVDTLEVFAGDLFVGGKFHDTSSGTPFVLEHIARYDPDTDAWLSLPGGGVNGDVRTIAATGLGVYVGGAFTSSADYLQTLNRIAFFSANSWSELPENGLNNLPYTLAAVGNDLYVGGPFTSTGDGTPLNHIARLHNNNWTSLERNGLDDDVREIANLGGDLWVAGSFSQTADDPITLTGLNGLTRYRPPTDSFVNKELQGNPIGFMPFQGGIGLNGEVRAIESGPGGVLYVGGDFLQSYDGTVGLGRIARFDPVTKQWSALALGGLNGRVRALAVNGNTLYVGGDFTRTIDNSIVLNRIARYDLTTNTWTAMPRNGLDNGVYAMKVVGNDLYLGGLFQNTRDFVQRLNLIARYDMTANTWSQLANDGFSGGVVMTLGSRGSDLIVGGYFFGNGDGSNQNIRNLVFYNTTSGTWTMPANVGLDSFVEVMAIDGDQAMFRGTFQGTADQTIVGFNGLANYDFSTSQWSFVNGNAETRELLVKTNASKRVGNDMYIGGSFTTVGGRIAMYFTRIYLQQWGGLAPFAMSTDWFAGANWTTGTPPVTGTSVVIPAGTGPIDISSDDVVLGDLMLNGGTLSVGAGRTLTINGTLSLSGGKINGPGSVIVTSCKPDAVMVGSSNSYVETALTRCVNDIGAYNFDVGTANGYSPVTVKNITGTGNVSVKANQGAYSGPAIGLPANRLARWWQIQNPGGGVTGANLFLSYIDGDVSGTEANYGAYRISGGTANLLPSTVNIFSNTVNAPNITGFSDWTLADLSPTAANVSIGGRVTTAAGNGIGKTTVTLTDQSGNVRVVVTNAFGYYRFENVEAGQSYVIAAQNKRFQFVNPTQIISVRSDVTDADFVSSP